MVTAVVIMLLVLLLMCEMLAHDVHVCLIFSRLLLFSGLQWGFTV